MSNRYRNLTMSEVMDMLDRQSWMAEGGDTNVSPELAREGSQRILEYMNRFDLIEEIVKGVKQ